MVEAVNRGSGTPNAARIVPAKPSALQVVSISTALHHRLALISRRGGDLHCSQANHFLVRYGAAFRAVWPVRPILIGQKGH